MRKMKRKVTSARRKVTAVRRKVRLQAKTVSLDKNCWLTSARNLTHYD